MKIKRIEAFQIPQNLNEILSAEGIWEDESFEPIYLTVEEIQYDGKELISFQALFSVLDEHEAIDGHQWEQLIQQYIAENEPELIQKFRGDSESSTCVIWTDNEADSKRILRYMIALLSDK